MTGWAWQGFRRPSLSQQGNGSSSPSERRGSLSTQQQQPPQQQQQQQQQQPYGSGSPRSSLVPLPSGDSPRRGSSALPGNSPLRGSTALLQEGSPRRGSAALPSGDSPRRGSSALPATNTARRSSAVHFIFGGGGGGGGGEGSPRGVLNPFGGDGSRRGSYVPPFGQDDDSRRSSQGSGGGGPGSRRGSYAPPSFWMERTMRILFVRHGETDYNVAGVIQGQMDTPLNRLGREQALATGFYLKQDHIDVVYASPLQRASDTARAIVYNNPNHPPLYLDDRLKERAFGTLEGQQFRGEKTDFISGIEQSNRFSERLASFWNDLIERPEGPWTDAPYQEQLRRGSSPGLQNGSEAPLRGGNGEFSKTIVIVGHGAALSALLGVISEYSTLAAGVKTSRLWNCSITEIHARQNPRRPSATPQSISISPGHISKMEDWRFRPPHLLRDVVEASETRKAQANNDTEGPAAVAKAKRDEKYKQRVHEAGIEIVRWADTAHLESKSAAAVAAAGGATGVSKDDNADEMAVEEQDEIGRVL